jgi:hypothetical protein
MDVHRLGYRRPRSLVDDQLGSGNIGADVDRPRPLRLTALHHVEIPVITVDGHRCRARQLVWWSRRARTEQCNREGGRGHHDSVPHRITSTPLTKVLGPAVMLFSQKENANIGGTLVEER